MTDTTITDWNTAEDASEPFTLQDYFTPIKRRRLTRFPQLLGVSFGIVWRAARREFVEIVLIQAVSAGANVLVAGTAAFRGGPSAYAANIQALRGGG